MESKGEIISSEYPKGVVFVSAILYIKEEREEK